MNGTCLHIRVKIVDIGYKDGSAFGSSQSIRRFLEGEEGRAPSSGIVRLHQNLRELDYKLQKL